MQRSQWEMRVFQLPKSHCLLSSLDTPLVSDVDGAKYEDQRMPLATSQPNVGLGQTRTRRAARRYTGQQMRACAHVSQTTDS